MITDLIKIIERLRKWAEPTFGPRYNYLNICDHLQKEIIEVLESEGNSLEEWCDIIGLAIHGAVRAGFPAEQIAMQLKHKQAINEYRKWPDWRTAEPGKAIEHIRDETAGDGDA